MWLNYDETYAVSEDGLVMNKETGKILKGTLNERYLVVSIGRKNKTIHRLIAERFLPKIDLPGLMIDHINRDKTDNRACNLRWCSASVNAQNRAATHITRSRYGYQVRIIKNKIVMYRKYFQTLEEATAARDAFKNSPEYLSA